MTYSEQDLWYFVRLAPTLSLSTPKRAMHYLERKAQTLVEMRDQLAQYPHLQVEHLDFWYHTLRSLGMIDSASLQGLFTRCTWRGVVWGGWLSLLLPNAEFLPVLAAVPDFPHDNEWAVRAAIEEIEDRPLQGQYELVRRMARKCRHYVQRIAIVKMPLRQQPSPAERAAFEEAQNRVREAYLREGTDAALVILRSSVLNDVIAEYPVWYRKTHGIESRRDYIKRWLR